MKNENEEDEEKEETVPDDIGKLLKENDIAYYQSEKGREPRDLKDLSKILHELFGAQKQHQRAVMVLDRRHKDLGDDKLYAFQPPERGRFESLDKLCASALHMNSIVKYVFTVLYCCIWTVVIKDLN